MRNPFALSPRRPARLVALTALLAVVLAGPGLLAPARAPATAPFVLPPSGMKTERFWVSVTAKQVVRYVGPKLSGGDCYYHWERQTVRRETVLVHAAPQKLLAVESSGFVSFHFGTWSLTDAGNPNFPGKGSTSRVDQGYFSQGAGLCGGKPLPPAPSPRCETQHRFWDIALNYDEARQRLAVTAGSPFETNWPPSCPILAPADINLDAITPVFVRFPRRELFARYDKQIILGHRHVKTGPYEYAIDWALTLKRPRGKRAHH